VPRARPPSSDSRRRRPPVARRQRRHACRITLADASQRLHRERAHAGCSCWRPSSARKRGPGLGTSSRTRRPPPRDVGIRAGNGVRRALARRGIAPSSATASIAPQRHALTRVGGESEERRRATRPADPPGRGPAPHRRAPHSCRSASAPHQPGRSAAADGPSRPSAQVASGAGRSLGESSACSIRGSGGVASVGAPEGPFGVAERQGGGRARPHLIGYQPLGNTRSATTRRPGRVSAAGPGRPGFRPVRMAAHPLVLVFPSSSSTERATAPAGAGSASLLLRDARALRSSDLLPALPRSEARPSRTCCTSPCRAAGWCERVLAERADTRSGGGRARPRLGARRREGPSGAPTLAPAPLPRIEQALDSPSERLRAEATWALGRLGTVGGADRPQAGAGARRPARVRARRCGGRPSAGWDRQAGSPCRRSSLSPPTRVRACAGARSTPSPSLAPMRGTCQRSSPPLPA